MEITYCAPAFADGYNGNPYYPIKYSTRSNNQIWGEFGNKKYAEFGRHEDAMNKRIDTTPK